MTQSRYHVGFPDPKSLYKDVLLRKRLNWKFLFLAWAFSVLGSMLIAPSAWSVILQQLLGGIA